MIFDIINTYLFERRIPMACKKKGKGGKKGK